MHPGFLYPVRKKVFLRTTQKMARNILAAAGLARKVRATTIMNGGKFQGVRLFRDLEYSNFSTSIFVASLPAPGPPGGPELVEDWREGLGKARPIAHAPFADQAAQRMGPFPGRG